jgi:hypothetical protein
MSGITFRNQVHDFKLNPISNIVMKAPMVLMERIETTKQYKANSHLLRGSLR